MAAVEAQSSLAVNGRGANAAMGTTPRTPSDIGVRDAARGSRRVSISGQEISTLATTSTQPAQPMQPKMALSVQGAQVAVQQALKQQEALTVEQQRQIQVQVRGLQQLLQAQAAGMLQTMAQIKQLQAELEPQLGASPHLRGQFDNLQQTQVKLGGLHQMLQGQLMKLQQTQTEAQKAHLTQTQGHIGGLYTMLQAQTAQLQNTQVQVAELQNFANAARQQVQIVTLQQDARLQQTQAHVLKLQAKLEEQHVTQVSLQNQITLRATTPSKLSSIGATVLATPQPMASARSCGTCDSETSIGMDRSVVKARMEELEDELIKLGQFLPESDEESV